MTTLKPDQLAAVSKFLEFIEHPTEREMVLEGFPGCGKSYVTKYMLEALKNLSQVSQMIGGDPKNVETCLTATTNKAAVVLGGFIGNAAGTIHSLLGLKVQNDLTTGKTKLVPASKGNRLPEHDNLLIIIDEASYVDDYLLKIIRSQTYDCKILYVGDRYQLANVGTTQPPVFYNIDNKVTLTESKRFNENGAIAQAGKQLRHTIDTGEWLPLRGNGVDIIEADSATFQQMIDQEFTSITHLSEDARVLAWTNKRVEQYNNYIRGKFTNDPVFEVGEEVLVSKTLHLAGSGNMPIIIPVESELIVEDVKDYLGMLETNPLNHRMYDGIGERVFGLEQDWSIPGNWIKFKKQDEYVFVPTYYDDYHLLMKHLTKQAKQNKSWHEYFYAKDYIADVRSAFATTVYKAQGSTYKKVFIDLEDIGKCNQWEQVARMLHVAITRASDQVILRGRLPSKYGG